MIRTEKAFVSIGVAATMTDTTPHTLHIYEQEGLIAPQRKGKWRYFSMEDIQWIKCLQKMIRNQGISIAAVKRLLQLTPCWNVCDCPFAERKQCTAFMASGLVPRKIDLAASARVRRIDIAEAA